MIEYAANQILQRNTENDILYTVENAWVYYFIKHLSNKFKLVKQKPKNKTRLNTEDLGQIQHWYNVLEEFISQILLQNIYNFDETGF